MARVAPAVDFAKFELMFKKKAVPPKKPNVVYETSEAMNSRIALMEKYDKAIQDLDKMRAEIERLKEWRASIDIKSEGETNNKKRKAEELYDADSDVGSSGPDRPVERPVKRMTRSV